MANIEHKQTIQRIKDEMAAKAKLKAEEAARKKTIKAPLPATKNPNASYWERQNSARQQAHELNKNK